MENEPFIETTHYTSPYGVFVITGSENGIKSVQLQPGAKDPRTPAPPVLAECVRQLNEYFCGQREEFKLKLDLSEGSEFFQKVWRELLQVKYGHTISYLKIAEKLGDKNAVRAVGMANKRNPIAIIIPCHRCIAKSGNLQGYFYGLDMKRKLLQAENPLSFAEQGRLF